MNDQDFYTAVAASDFSERYYELCSRYPVRGEPPCHPSSGIVEELLMGAGRATKRDTRDNSYSCELRLPQGMLNVGFVIQKQVTLEFWFWLDQVEQRVGGSYAIIASESSKLVGNFPPQPPYPRPEFHSVVELRVILGECFDLADLLILTLKLPAF